MTWHNESRRHSMARRGIKTAQKIPKMKNTKTKEPEMSVKIGDIIQRGKNKYRVVRITSQKKNYPNFSFILERAYLKSLNSKENRIGIIRDGKIKEFETGIEWTTGNRYYKDWFEK